MQSIKFSTRNLSISPPLLLAPMVGVSHSALRIICAGFGGVGLFFTEMLAARRLPFENPFISPYLIKTEVERPLCCQLFVTNPDEIPPAIAALHRYGADAIDLNLGCPAPKVRSAGGGSRLMAEVDTVRKIIAAARRETELPISAKIRLGEKLDKENLQNFCLMLEGEGIDFVTVHARLRKESFQRKPRWEWVGYVKDWLTIPVIANGSIFSVEDARACLRASHADGLMIGRAVPEKPWIFAEIARELYGFDTPGSKVVLPAVYSSMARNLQIHFRSERRLGRLKEFTHYFARNYHFGHRLASAVQSSGSFEEACDRASSFFAVNDPDGWAQLGENFL